MWEKDHSDWKKENGRYVKEDCLVLDFGGNTARFGYVEDYDAFGLLS